MRLSAERLAEIEEQRAERRPTARPVSAALEDALFAPRPVLDQGFVRVIDYMGDDAAIVQAARVSYGKGTKKISSDKALIDYLLRRRHTTPFEMCEIKLHVKLPVFVARQWIRHRTASVNEYSARYSVVEDDFYSPALGRLAEQSASNRQGSGASLPPERAETIRRSLDREAERAFALYRDLIGDEDGEGEPGLARELARIALPLSTYTEWYWKTDLHNLMHFVKLRADPHAQDEIRAYADEIHTIMKLWTPLAADAFERYRMQAVELSGPALAALSRMLDGETLDAEKAGLSAREWREVMAALGRDQA